MTAPEPIQLSSEALHRIRLAAGGFPADLKPVDLGRQLSKAVYDCHSLSLRNIKAQKVRLKAIQKTASKLAALLADDEENAGLDWCSQWPKNLPPPSKVAEEIKRMTEESGVLKASAELRRPRRRDHVRPPAPKKLPKAWVSVDDEVAFALPFNFAEDDYVQIITDMAAELGPRLGWRPAQSGAEPIGSPERATVRLKV